MRSALLGIGAYPKKTKRENAGLVVVQPLVRFDTQEVSTHAKLVRPPAESVTVGSQRIFSSARLRDGRGAALQAAS